MENHIDTLDPLCTPEALVRWYYYPPPFYDTINHIWKYRHPWLWYDGNKHGGRDYVNWRGRIMNEMNVPASVAIAIHGSYDPVTRNGTMRIVYRNDSSGTIHGARAIAAITQDSINHLAPSGDSMHNNVLRDYVPDPYGQVISIPPGDSAIIAQYFTLDTAWDFNKCTIVTWLQNDSLTADSTKPIYQGGKKPVSELDQSDIEELVSPRSTASCRVMPNPCKGRTQFLFDIGTGTRFRIAIFDAMGRKIREITGSASTPVNRVQWDGKNEKNETVHAGVYFYRIESDPMSPALCGKIIVR